MDWNAFAADYAQFPLPETEEWEKAEGRRIPSRPVETEEFIRLEYLYKFLAELLLSEQYGLSQLDRRLTEEGYLPVPEEKQDYFQKYDRSGLQFFCLRCPVHIERLTKEELRILTAASAFLEEQTMSEAVSLVQRTFTQVLMTDPEKGDAAVLLEDRMDGSGEVQGNSILLGITSWPDLTDGGMIRDRKADGVRTQLFLSVAEQLEEILSRALAADVRVTADL